MSEATMIGVDISRSVFQLHGSTKSGRCVYRKRMNRQEFMEFMSNHPCSVVGLEACGGSNWVGRRLKSYGHEVRVIPPQYVKPYVKRNKNDAADAEAIVEAMSRENMRFSAIKSVEQQEIGQLHRAREQQIKHRTALVNQIKGFLNEFGIVLRCGHSKLFRDYIEVLDTPLGKELGTRTKQLLSNIFDDLHATTNRIQEYEASLKQCHESNELSQLVATIPGIGTLTASAIFSVLGNGSQFCNGRECAASVGVTPRQMSSGNMQRLGGISKRGDAYLRKLLIQGAHAVVNHVIKRKDRLGDWLLALIERRGRCKAVVALANKNLRIVWALLKKKETFRVSLAVSAQRA